MKVNIFLLIAIIMSSSPAYTSETLIASGHAEYPPFMWKEGEKIIGVAAELTTIIFSELGITVTYPYAGPWKRLQKSAKAGDIDLILGIYKNDQRLSYLAYSGQAYTPDPVVIFVKKGAAFPYAQWKDLIGKRGGAMLGGSFEQKFDLYEAKNLDVHRVKHIQQSFGMMLLGRLDYVIYGQCAGKSQLIEMAVENEIDHLTMPLVTPLIYQAFSKKSKFIKHLPYLSKRVSELKADGTVDKLIKKYKLLWKKSVANHSHVL